MHNCRHVSLIPVDWNFKTDDKYQIQCRILSRALFINILRVKVHILERANRGLNNKYAKYYDGSPYAEDFVRQAYREAGVVLGPFPVWNLGFRASVRASVQTTAQSGPVPSLQQIQPVQAVELKNAPPRLWAAEMGTAQNGRSVDKFRQNDAKDLNARTQRRTSTGAASHHSESSIPDTYLNSCIPFFRR